MPTPASAEGFLPQQSNLSRPVRAPKWLKRPCGATFGDPNPNPNPNPNP